MDILYRKLLYIYNKKVSDELQFEAYCDGWLTYGAKFINEFDNLILLICRYGGGECYSMSIEDAEYDIKYAIKRWIDEWNIDVGSINFEFIHLEE